MDFETMLKLVNAGFTKDDIMKLSEPTKPTEPTTPAKPTEPTKPAEPTEPTKPAEPTEPTNDVMAQLTAQVTDLAKIVKDMQDNNIKSAKMDTPKETTALDAVKSFFGDVSTKEGK